MEMVVYRKRLLWLVKLVGANPDFAHGAGCGLCMCRTRSACRTGRRIPGKWFAKCPKEHRRLTRILHTGPDEGWPGRGAACEW